MSSRTLNCLYSSFVVGRSRLSCFIQSYVMVDYCYQVTSWWCTNQSGQSPGTNWKSHGIWSPVWGQGTPLPLVHLLPHLFPLFYFSLSFIGFTYFLLLSIPSLSTRIVPLRFLQCFDTVGWVIWSVKTRPRCDL